MGTSVTIPGATLCILLTDIRMADSEMGFFSLWE